MKLELDLESRKCRYCGKGFKCLHTSKIDYCSSECAKKSGLWSGKSWGRNGEGSVRSMSVRDTASGIKTQNSGSEKVSGASERPKPIQSVSASDQERSTGKTKSETTLENSNGNERTESTSNNTGESTMPKTSPVSSLASLPSATEKTLPELSDESREPLEMVALDSMKLLQKSGNKLMQLIDESVSAEDLEKSVDGAVRVAGHKIEIAIHAANTLAQTVQTQVNMVKAYTDLKRHLEK